MVGAVALALTFAQSPDKSPPTPEEAGPHRSRFLARATNTIDSDLPFGQAQNQAYGYLFRTALSVSHWDIRWISSSLLFMQVQCLSFLWV